ncbi:hypothetical protein GQ457_12G008940 [Hibiscus cannabinus]
MSENQGDQGNSRSLATGTPSGRPPDFVQGLVVSSGGTEEEGKLVHHVQSESLERPRSPISLDSQGQCKKPRGTGVHDPIEVPDAMEMDLQREQVSPVVARLESEGQQCATNVEDGGCRLSYANVVNGVGRKTAMEHSGVDEIGGDPNKISVSDDDCVIDRTGKFPRIEFSENVHKQIDLAMQNVIIVRLLGRNIGYQTLLNRIHAVWKPMGEMQLIDLENSYFLVRIEDPRDYRKILTEGPWTIYGSYLTVQPWSRSFSTSEKHPSRVVVWVRLPGLPYKYYSKALFRRIAAIVGEVVRVDYNTQAGERGKFARLAVTVDLNKPLVPCIGIDDFIQKLEYDGLNLICYKCGVYGHLQEACGKPEDRVQETTDRVVHTAIGNNSTVGSSNNGELFGPWMTVDTRRKRSNNGGSMLTKGLRKPDVRANANRFAALGAEQVDLMEEHRNVDNVASGVLSPSSGQPRNISEEGGVSASKDASSSGSHLVTEIRVPNRVVEKTVVLPMVEGQQVSVVQHTSMGSGQRHTAFSLLEKGHGRTGVEGVVLGKARGGRRLGKEISHQGLRVRKPPDTKTVSRAVLNEWVDEVNGQLTAIADSSGSDPGGRLRASVNQEGVLVPVRLDPEKPKSRDSVRGGDSGIGMGESHGDC